MKNSYSISHLLALVPKGVLKNCSNPDDIKIENLVSLTETKDHAVAFVSSKLFVQAAQESKASLLLVTEEIADLFDRPIIIAKDPSLAIIPIINLFHPPRTSSGQISDKAHIEATAVIGDQVEIGPFASVGKNTVVGRNCIIEGGAFLGENVTIGDNSRVGPNDVIHNNVKIGKNFRTGGNCTIGADGFRFAFGGGIHNKVPQIGGVVIGNNVEMGAGCTVDRGGIDDTTIGNGVKFDNMVHIAHNCVLKDHIVIAAQSGMAGSTTVGNYVMLSGHVALQDHIEIADGVMVGGKTAIRKSIKDKGVYNGEYCLPLDEYKGLRKNLSNLINFENWAQKITTLEAQVKSLLPKSKNKVAADKVEGALIE